MKTKTHHTNLLKFLNFSQNKLLYNYALIAMIILILLYHGLQENGLFSGLFFTIIGIFLILQDFRGKIYSLSIIVLGVISFNYNNPEPNHKLELGQTTVNGIVKNIKIKIKYQDTLYQILLKTPEKKIYQAYTPINSIKIGDHIQISGELQKVNSKGVPGAFNYEKYLLSKGIFGNFNRKKCQIKILETSNNLWLNKYASVISHKIKLSIDNTFNGGYAGILEALFLGIKTDLPTNFSENFRKAGLFHVLAISGFHVGLISIVIMMFLKYIRFSANTARIISVIILFIYIPVSNSSESVQRAVIMFSVFNLAQFFKRPAQSLNNLGIAGTIILLLQPLSVFSIGFQLSFIASSSIIYLNPLGKKICANISAPKKIKEYIIMPILITLWATLGTSFYMVNTFHWFAPVSFIGSIIVIPLISLAMISTILSLITSSLFFISDPFATSTKLFLYLSDVVTLKINQIPYAGFSTPTLPFVFWFCFYTILFMLGQMANTPKISNRLRTIFFSLAISCTAYFCYIQIDKLINPKIKVTFIDVGQGDSILLQFPGNTNFLIDTGNLTKFQNSNKSSLKPYLTHLGISQIDALIITHSDADHYAAGYELLDIIKVKNIYTNYVELDSAIINKKANWKRFLTKADSLKISISGLQRGHSFKGSNWELTNLSPAIDHNYTNPNNASLTFILKFMNKNKLLLSGDLEEPMEEELLALNLIPKNIPYFKGGHHGSKTSNSLPLLKRINPEYVFISSGKKKLYGHPSKEVIDNLEELEINYSVTNAQGSLFLTINENDAEISSFNN